MKLVVLLVLLIFLLSGCEAVAIGNIILNQDSDGDGLTNKEERLYGTNPKLSDTDGDSLSDYHEIMVMGTSPIDKNTDKDRYDDSLDKEPLKKNSAEITAKLKNKKVEMNWFNIASIVMSLGVVGILKPDTEIAGISGDVEILNSGDDYTSYVNYDIFIFHNCGSGYKRLASLEKSIARMDPGDKDIKYFDYSITTDILTEAIPALLKDRKCDFDARVQNLRFEKY